MPVEKAYLFVSVFDVAISVDVAISADVAISVDVAISADVADRLR